MDLIGIGINSKRNRRLLKEINDNNTITLKLYNHIVRLNSFTNEFLTLQTPQLIDKVAPSHQQDLDKYQQLFQDIFYLYSVDNVKLKKLPTPSLQQLKKFYDQLTQGEQNFSVANDPLIESLNSFINSYITISLNHEVSNLLIYNTIIYYNQLSYWDNLSGSSWWKLVYGLQILPEKLFAFVCSSVEAPEEDVSARSFVEEDNVVIRNLVYGKKVMIQLGHVLVKRFKQLLIETNPLILIKSSDKIPKEGSNFLSIAWNNIQGLHKLPFRLINGEINAKIKEINHKLNNNYTKINYLINNVPKNEISLLSLENEADFCQIGVLESLLDLPEETSVNKRINRVLSKLIQLSSDNKQFSSTDKPSFWTRYWPLMVLTLKFGPGLGMDAYTNRWEIVKWIKFNLVDTVVGFWRNWVIEPINQMVGILRNDEINELSITSKESLTSDLNSLQRMVVDYAVDYETASQPHLDKVELTSKINEMVSQGDLTVVMSNYEQDLRAPVKSILRGSLIRGLLIQIQKTKVDGSVAINGIDKLLKSQQLVFGVVSISPSIFILYQLYQYFNSSSFNRIADKQLKISCLKNLNNIEKLLTADDDVKDGKIFVEIINLILISTNIIPRELKSDWLRDLNQLNDIDIADARKVAIITRVWNMYGPYFR